jgi:dihydrofolate reductase
MRQAGISSAQLAEGVCAMRQVRYSVAMSLDGYIAGLKGEADWIVMDPELDFAALWAQFDTLLMGRRTYEAAVARLGLSMMKGKRIVVASRTLKAEEAPEVRVIQDLTKAEMQALRSQASKDIWLMGGGVIFSHLLGLKEVDSIEVVTVPVLLSEGIPLVSAFEGRVQLKLEAHRVYRSGIVSLSYAVQY